ncbi:MAG: peptidase domain-containing ABC transporter [Bacteroidetes bacterium]|nr:peptidase domain-containing ABC transporter [Bacteroidota bacterium]
MRLGDPARGIIEISTEELGKIWQSKALLSLKPNNKFIKQERTQKQKQQWLLGLVREDFPILGIATVLGIVIAALGISTAIFSQKLIDDILPKGNTQKLIVSLALVTLLLLARSGLSFLRGLFMVRQGQDFNNRMIGHFYGHLLRLPKSFFDTRKIGELIARMNDTRRVQAVISTLTGSVAIDLLLVLVSVSFVFIYAWQVGAVVMLSLPVYVVVLYRFNKPLQQAQKEVMIGYAQAESNFIDTMQGIAEVKGIGKENFFEKMNASIYGLFQESMATLGKLNIRFGLTSEMIGVVFLMAIFGNAAWLVLDKQLLLGEMVALLSMAGNIIPSVNRLVIANVQIQEAKVAFDRMYEFTSMEKDDLTPSPSPERDLGLTQANSKTNAAPLSDGEGLSLSAGQAGVRSLRLEKISFRFPGRKQILKDISLEVKKGEMVALLGESGGGKSTTLQLIQKFYQPESGSIFVNGTNLSEIGNHEWRSTLGCVPQEVKIFNGSLLFNITLSDKPEDFQRAVAYCEEAGFGKFFNELPQGYLTLVGEEGINLSGGQKQLVALARTLFRKPTLLLLDEATSAMDKKTENYIIELLLKLKKEMAILMVTHRTQTADRCTRQYVMEEGVCKNPKSLAESD